MREKYVDVDVFEEISSFSRRISSFSVSISRMTWSFSQFTFRPNSIFPSIFWSTSLSASYVPLRNSLMSFSVRKTVPKLIGRTVKSFMTTSLTCSWASAFSRVGSKTIRGQFDTTAPNSL